MLGLELNHVSKSGYMGANHAAMADECHYLPFCVFIIAMDCFSWQSTVNELMNMIDALVAIFVLVIVKGKC